MNQMPDQFTFIVKLCKARVLQQWSMLRHHEKLGDKER